MYLVEIGIIYQVENKNLSTYPFFINTAYIFIFNKGGLCTSFSNSEAAIMKYPLSICCSNY